MLDVYSRCCLLSQQYARSVVDGPLVVCRDLSSPELFGFSGFLLFTLITKAFD